MSDENNQNSAAPYERADDFSAVYANNVQFEASVWDLKIIFGLLEQSISPLAVKQHTSVNVPWAQVKLMAYYLQVNLVFHEAQHGRIPLPEGLIPPPPDDWEKGSEDPVAKDIANFMRRLREEMFPGSQ